MNKSAMGLISFFVSLMLFFSCSAKSETTWSSSKFVDSKIASMLYNPQHNTILGNPNAPITIVEFFDYNCPYCRELRPEMDKLIQRNPDVRIVYKEYILFGENSELATRAALAAQNQGKYLNMQSALLKASNPLDYNEIMQIAKTIGLNTQQLSQDMKNPDVLQQVKQNNELSETLKIEGAPAFIVANSKVMNNPQNTAQYFFLGPDTIPNLQKLIDKARLS